MRTSPLPNHARRRQLETEHLARRGHRARSRCSARDRGRRGPRRHRHLPAVRVAGCRGRARAWHGRRTGRTERRRRRSGRIHGRGLCTDARRARMPLRHRRPLRTPRAVRRDRRRRGRSRQRRHAARSGAHRVRRRDAGSAHERRRRSGCAPTAQRIPLRSGYRLWRCHRRRLRTRLGHRHRGDGLAAAGARHARDDPRGAPPEAG